MKKKTKWIIYDLLRFYGFKPKEVIDMGYSPSTVYRYNKAVKETKKEFGELKKDGFKRGV
jgi:hypothetical protein